MITVPFARAISSQLRSAATTQNARPDVVTALYQPPYELVVLLPSAMTHPVHGGLAPRRIESRGPRARNDLVAQVYALIANRHTGTSDQQLDLLLPLIAEAAFQLVIHDEFPFIAAVDTASLRPGQPRRGHLTGLCSQGAGRWRTSAQRDIQPGRAGRSSLDHSANL